MATNQQASNENWNNVAVFQVNLFNKRDNDLASRINGLPTAANLLLEPNGHERGTFGQ